MLSPRHRRFAEQVAIGKTYTDAYKASGFEAEGENARRGASELANQPDVKAEIENILAAAQEAAGIDAAWWLREMATLYRDPRATVAERTRIAELVGKRLRLLGNDAPTTSERVYVLMVPEPAVTVEAWVEHVQANLPKPQGEQG